MSKKTSTYQWKKTEKKASEFVNSKRNPFSGSNGGLSHSDSIQDRLFLECKTKKKHSVKSLYDETSTLAKKENKIPVVVLRETDSDEILWVIKQEDLGSILKEIDINVIDKRIKKGTTVYTLLEQQTGLNQDIYSVKSNLNKRLKELLMAKVVSNDILEEVKAISLLLQYIDFIDDYIKEGFEK